MNLKLIASAVLIALSGLAVPAQASDSKSTLNLAQAPITAREVLEACVQNRAETLPNPYVDVPRNHWAYKAVLTMHYCGAYRQATPPALIERLLQQSSPSQSSSIDSTTLH